MGLPLIPFAAGLAVGALAGYGSRQSAVQKQVKSGAEQVVAGAEWLYGSVVGGLSNLLGASLGGAKPREKGGARIESKAEEAEKPAPAKRTRARKTPAKTTQKRASTGTRRRSTKTATA
jgi:hypothetical protein